MVLWRWIVIYSILFVPAKFSSNGFCDANSRTCLDDRSIHKLLFYDVNPPEGFNLRRDVYMRFAIMMAEAQKNINKQHWSLVLPPWYMLYHWRSKKLYHDPLPWSTFFDVESLKSFAPVLELNEAFNRNSGNLVIDTLFILQNFDDPFEGGRFVDKWVIHDRNCEYNGVYSWYTNITFKETVCVQFQGSISKLWELISVHPNDRSVMFAHGEIPLHDTYGTKTYWDCRKSMKFRKELEEFAREFMKKNLDCKINKCNTYLSVHWRRQDFVQSRMKDIPSINGTVNQIDKTIREKIAHIRRIFIATDATTEELTILQDHLKRLGYEVFSYLPSKNDINTFKDGGIAIIDQIICSHAAWFLGTHESTFTFRIQEEREILGFDSKTTFNRLCPDKGNCERPSKWTIIN